MQTPKNSSATSTLASCSTALALLAASSLSTHAATAKLQPVASGFTAVIGLTPLPNSDGQMIAVDQIGVATVLDKSGKQSATTFLDVRPKLTKLNAGFDERGLLGLALHPNFNQNGRVFVTYNTPLRPGVDTNWNSTLRISEFKVSNPAQPTADPASEKIILEWDKPHFNHNGGCIAFGPDGLLYIGAGDGGAGNGIGLGHSPISNGQDLTTLLGKILRIDINTDGSKPYSIPSDNPYAKGGGRPEIYALGFRNPWRLSFDRGGSHELFAADVGQTLYEEVNIVTKGGNYGWFVREGRICFDPQNPKVPKKECTITDAAGNKFIDPAIEYKNANGFRKDPDAYGISITGGYVYRGKSVSKLSGKYVFGDWSKNWALPQGALLAATRPEGSQGGQWSIEPLKVEITDGSTWKSYITAFGEDSEGELYVLTNGYNSLINGSGKIFKIVAVD